MTKFANTPKKLPLSELTDLIQYGFTAKSSSSTQGPKYLRITDIQNDHVDWNVVPRVTIDSDSFARYQLLPGDIVFARSGATVGKSFLINGNVEPAVFASYLIRVRCKTTYLLPEYAALFFRSEEYWQQIREGATGTGQPNFNGTKLGELRVPVHPLDEQCRIVAKLDSLFERSKSARAQLARVPRLVERYKQAILAAAFRGDLTKDWRAANEDIEPASSTVARTRSATQPKGGRTASSRVIPGVAALSINNPGTEPPQGWAWVSLNRIARQETGHTPSRAHPEWWGADIPWIGIKDASMYHGGIIQNTLQNTNLLGLANSAARLLPAGTVCLSRTASVGYVVIMGRDMATSQDFVTWTCNEALIPKFLMYALMAEGDEIRRFGKGSTHTTIYFPEVRALHICLAPLSEQTEIVRRIENLFTHIDKLLGEATFAFDLLDRLDKTTLAKAYRGELLPSKSQVV